MLHIFIFCFPPSGISGRCHVVSRGWRGAASRDPLSARHRVSVCGGGGVFDRSCIVSVCRGGVGLCT